MAWSNLRDVLKMPNFGNMFQSGEREIELGGGHSVKSHGAKLAWTHRNDWIILLLLVGIELVLNIIHPFYRFVGRDMLDDLKYPFKGNTVPMWSVPVMFVITLFPLDAKLIRTLSYCIAGYIIVLLPIAIFSFIYLRRRDVYDLHNAILGLLSAALITGVITDSIKNATGRPRPNFFWRCFPEGKDIYDALGNVICNGKESDIREGHKSFPSGHTSWSFAGLGFLSLYLAGKIKVFDQRGHVSKLCLVFLPLLFAALVGASRVDDYWHHWQDVFVGGLIGLSVATFCYLQFFPPPYHSECWGPYAYFRAKEQSGTNPHAGNTMNGIDVHTMGAQSLVQRPAMPDTAGVPPSHNTPDYYDLELGNN